MSDNADRDEALRQLGEADPRLLELTLRARAALEELGAYLAEKALDAGAVLPEDLRCFLAKRPQP